MNRLATPAWRRWWSLAAFVGSMVGTSQACAQGVDIRIDNSRISVIADNTTLAAVAAELSERTGIPVFVSGDDSQRVSVSIIDEPLAGVVAAISANHLLKRRNDEPGAAIVEIVLLADDGDAPADNSTAATSGGLNDDSEFLPSGEPADGSPEGASSENPDAPAYDPSGLQQPEPPPHSGDQFLEQPDVPNSEPQPYPADKGG